MNNHELDKLLKSTRPPERSPDQWAALTRRIATRLHWQPRATEDSVAPGRPWFPKWGLGLAAACMIGLLAFALWPDRELPTIAANGSTRAAEYRFVELREMFPQQIRAIILSDTDARIDLSENADQSDAQPIYLKVCGPDGCKQVITFSGQRIRLNGEEWEILASGADGVIVTGNNNVWTSADPARRMSHFRIEAKQLKAS